MKHLFLFLCLCSLTLWGQDSPQKVEIVKNSSFEAAETYGNHEVRLNALSLLAGSVLDVNYERVSNASSGYGVGLLLNFGDTDYTSQDFAITPYYRFYFLNRQDYGAKGTYVELFSSFGSASSYIDSFDMDIYTYEETTNFQMSLGAAIGRKWVNKKGFSFELFLGVGRYLLDNDGGDEAHSRLGFSIGKRF